MKFLSNKKNKIVFWSVLGIALLIVGILLIKDTKIEATFNAYEIAIKGDNKNLKKLGIDEDVKTLSQETQDLGFSNIQKKVVHKAFKNVEIKVISESKIKGNDNEVKVIYEISTYPISQVQEDIEANREKYFDQDTFDILYGGKKVENKKSDAAFGKYQSVYEDLLMNLDTVKVKYEVVMKKNKEGNYELSEKDTLNLVRSIIKMNGNEAIK